MKVCLVLAAAATTAIVISLWWTRDNRGVVGQKPQIPLQPAEVRRWAKLDRADPKDSVDEERAQVVSQRTAVEPAPASATPVQRMRLAEIRGRLVFEGGAPAAGVLCNVDGWVGNQERALKYGVPADWNDPTSVTDEDGRFSMSFDPPRAFQFTLEVKAAGYAGAEWRWGEIEPRTVVDLGEVALVRGGTIEGRIIDRAGNALIGQNWSIYARSIGVGQLEGRTETQVITRVDQATGQYRVEDVMPGKVRLNLYSNIANDVEAPTVTVQAGETLMVDIVYAGPDNSRRITLRTFSEPFYVMGEPDPVSIKLLCPDGEIRTAEKILGSSQSYSFDDLEPGAYELEIDDPRYLSWRCAAVRPGASVDAQLQGSSALALNVVDAGGNTVPGCSVRVEFRDVTFFPSAFEIQPVGGFLEGLFPGDYTIRVTAGGLLGAVEVDGLAAGEARPVTVVMDAASTLSGRVTLDNGHPVASAEVLLLRPAEVDDSPWSPILTENMWTSDEARHRKEVDSTITDNLGGFHFAFANQGSYVVHAESDSSEASSEVVSVTNTGVSGLELVLPSGGRVRGSLRGPSSASLAGFRVLIEPETPIGVDEFSWTMRLQQRLAGDGGWIGLVGSDASFELGPVTAGLATAYLLLPEKGARKENGLSIGGGRIELGQIMVEGGVVVERDFEVRELPGTVELFVTVNGQPAPGVALQLQSREESGFFLSGKTDERGKFGPTLAFAEAYSIAASEPERGWYYTVPITLLVKPAADLHATIAIEVATAKVLFVDRETGRPLLQRRVSVFETTSPFLRASRETDEDGYALFTLAQGEYRFVLSDEELTFLPSDELPTNELHMATLTWAALGPREDRVGL